MPEILSLWEKARAAVPKHGAEGPVRHRPLPARSAAAWHGGAQGSGARKGNQNALKTGFYTREAIEEQRARSKLIRDMRDELKEIEELS